MTVRTANAYSMLVGDYAADAETCCSCRDGFRIEAGECVPLTCSNTDGQGSQFACGDGADLIADVHPISFKACCACRAGYAVYTSASTTACVTHRVARSSCGFTVLRRTAERD